MEFQNSQLFRLLTYPSGDVLKGREIYSEIENLGVKNLSFVSKGYRGVVFKGELNGREVAVKVPRSDSGKGNFILKECEVLKYLSERLGKENPAPFPYGCSSNFLVMEWIDGLPFYEAFEKFGMKVVLNALKACFLLDEAGVEHSEIKGGKHLIYSGNRVRVIDFESSKFKENPRNLLQFFGHYVFGRGILNVDREEFVQLLELYKKDRVAGYKSLISRLAGYNSTANS